MPSTKGTLGIVIAFIFILIIFSGMWIINLGLVNAAAAQEIFGYFTSNNISVIPKNNLYMNASAYILNGTIIYDWSEINGTDAIGYVPYNGADQNLNLGNNNLSLNNIFFMGGNITYNGTDNIWDFR